jgi:hypothetical protein
MRVPAQLGSRENGATISRVPQQLLLLRRTKYHLAQRESLLLHARHSNDMTTVFVV